MKSGDLAEIEEVIAQTVRNQADNSSAIIYSVRLEDFGVNPGIGCGSAISSDLWGPTVPVRVAVPPR
jgi:hypothetical protein